MRTSVQLLLCFATVYTVFPEEQGRFFNIRPLGKGHYEIMADEGSLGSILLDSSDHAHCESLGCELDMPLLHAIREGIQTHENWSDRALACVDPVIKHFVGAGD